MTTLRDIPLFTALADALGLDAIVLVDGGTDILMRGDEDGLGTPAEDMTSLAAVAGLVNIRAKLVASIGFGIDAYHGVNHVQVLENLADLERTAPTSAPSPSHERRRKASCTWTP